MTDKDFIIKIINSVARNDCLWDPLSESYAKRDKLEIAWKKVSDECEKPVNFCKDKWKNVRTGFLRSLRDYPENSTVLGSLKVKKKPFYLYKYMQFLLPTVLRNDSSTVNQNNYADGSVFKTEDSDSTYCRTLKEEDSSSSEILVLDYEELDNFENVELPQQGYYTKFGASNSNKSALEQKHDVDEPPNKKYKFINYEDEIRETKEEMALMSFFKGIASDVLSLPIRNQRFFKRKLVELVDDLHQENERQQIISKHKQLSQRAYYASSPRE